MILLTRGFPCRARIIPPLRLRASRMSTAAALPTQPTNARSPTAPPCASYPNTHSSNVPNTMPPGFKATIADLPTFRLPTRITNSPSDLALGKALISAWRQDGIIQIAMDTSHKQNWADARAASRAFFGRPHAEKAACVDAQSYAGYIASGEEVTDGVADYSEIFTVMKDLGPEDPRVRAGWPCHGPCPWPDQGMKGVMTRFGEGLGREGEKLLRLAEMGLGVGEGELTRYTRDGWHHMRVLR